MAHIGYARVSTLYQKVEAQISALQAAGCEVVHEEKASGKSMKRPVLQKLLPSLRSGDTLVVVSLDRLGRSLMGLLEVIQGLKDRGIAVRSLNDPVDTTGSHGMFFLQIMAAVAELERRMIVDRTMAGIAAARAQGRVGGNPKLKQKGSQEYQEIIEARNRRYLEALVEDSDYWASIVKEMRPRQSWDKVVEAINKAKPEHAGVWTRERLVRACKRLVKEGYLSQDVLRKADRAPNRSRKNPSILGIVAGLKNAEPGLTYEGLAQRLGAMRIKTSRGKDTWGASTVYQILAAARDAGLLQVPLLRRGQRRKMVGQLTIKL